MDSKRGPLQTRSEKVILTEGLYQATDCAICQDTFLNGLSPVGGNEDNRDGMTGAASNSR